MPDFRSVVQNVGPPYVVVERCTLCLFIAFAHCFLSFPSGPFSKEGTLVQRAIVPDHQGEILSEYKGVPIILKILLLNVEVFNSKPNGGLLTFKSNWIQSEEKGPTLFSNILPGVEKQVIVKICVGSMVDLT